MGVGLVKLGAVPLLSYAEVADLGFTRRIEQDIARFEVSMQLVLHAVQVPQSAEDLPCKDRYHQLWNKWHLIVKLLRILDPAVRELLEASEVHIFEK